MDRRTCDIYSIVSKLTISSIIGFHYAYILSYPVAMLSVKYYAVELTSIHFIDMIE